MFLQSLLAPKPAAPVVAATPAATTPPPAAASVPVPVAAAAAAAQPVEDAGIAATLFSKVGESQNRFLANQQLIGEISAVVGARLTQTFSNVMRLLKGDPPPAAGVTG